MQESVQGRVDCVQRNAGLRRDPTRVGSKRGRPNEAHDRFRMLLHAGVGDHRRTESETPAEFAHHPWRQTAPAPQYLRERGVVGAEVARERPQ